MEIKELIGQNPVFAGLSGNDRERLLQQAILRKYEKGEYLTHAGDLWPFLFFLLEGSISAVKESAEGRSFVATSFKPGEVFWGVSFFYPDLPMPVALKVDLPGNILLWPREQILSFLLENGLMSWELCRLMIRRMLRASEIIETLAFQPVAGRLARLLVDISLDDGQGPVGRSLTLDDMAARIGSTREVVCRFLQRFAEEGVINITRTEFIVSDRERLIELAQKNK